MGAGSGSGYDDYWVEDHAIGDGGDIDLQFVDHNLPTFKLSFRYWKDQRSKVAANYTLGGGSADSATQVHRDASARQPILASG
jgi:hypothetical protein